MDRSRTSSSRLETSSKPRIVPSSLLMVAILRPFLALEDAPHSSMAGVKLLLVLLSAVVAIVLFSRKLQIPYPILLVVGGLGLSLIPELQRVRLDPELVFVLFLPPLLYPAALFTPWRDFHANLRTILILAVGLVLVTMVVTAWFAHRFIGMGWG